MLVASLIITTLILIMKQANEGCVDATKQLLTVFRSVPPLSAAPRAGASEAIIGLIVFCTCVCPALTCQVEKKGYYPSFCQRVYLHLRVNNHTKYPPVLSCHATCKCAVK